MLKSKALLDLIVFVAFLLAEDKMKTTIIITGVRPEDERVEVPLILLFFKYLLGAVRF